MGLEARYQSTSQEVPPAGASPMMSLDASISTSSIEQGINLCNILEITKTVCFLVKAITADDLPEDLFSVLFHCQDHTHPWKALLAYSIALERPLLALLAASYKVRPHPQYSVKNGASNLYMYICMTVSVCECVCV